MLTGWLTGCVAYSSGRRQGNLRDALRSGEIRSKLGTDHRFLQSSFGEQ